MTPQVISLSSATSTAWIPVDYKQNPYNISLALVFSNTPDLTCKVEYTLDNIFNSSVTPTAFTHASLTDITTDATGSITYPIKAFRLTVTSWTSGTVTLTALQGTLNPKIYTQSPTKATPKTTPVDADTLWLSDSESGGILRDLSWSNLETKLRLGTIWNVAKLSGLDTVGHLNIQRQTAGPNLYLDCISDHVTNGHAVYNMRRANGTPAALTGVVTGDEYGAIACRAHNGTDWEDHSGSLSWGATQDHTLTANGSGFGIYTVLNDTVGSWEALAIDGLGKTSIKGGLLVSGNLVTTLDLFSTVPAAQTVSFNGVNVQLSTAAASFTLTDLFQFRIRNASLGAGSAITRQTGLRVEDLTSGTSNFGIRSLVSSGSGKWNLFIDGTANNYILGNCGFGTNAPTQPVDVSGSKIRIRTANTPASAADTGAVGEICWDANYIYICVAANTWKRASIATW